MPDQPFSVHVDPDALASQELAAAVPTPSADGKDRAHAAAEEHPGARVGRQAARQQSGRARSARASGTGGGRSYAFRRS
jgi:hypothetical protein